MKKEVFRITLMKKNYKGMTLIEIIIVVSIISFLILAFNVLLRSQIFKANDARRKAELKRIGVAAEEYEKDKNCYPPPALVTCNNGGVGLRPYLDVIPCDSVTKASYYYEDDGTSCSKWYRIYAALQNEKDVDYLVNIGPNAEYSYYYSSPNAPIPTPAPGVTIWWGYIGGVCKKLSSVSECTPSWDTYENCMKYKLECVY